MFSRHLLHCPSLNNLHEDGGERCVLDIIFVNPSGQSFLGLCLLSGSGLNGWICGVFEVGFGLEFEFAFEFEFWIVMVVFWFTLSISSLVWTEGRGVFVPASGLVGLPVPLLRLLLPLFLSFSVFFYVSAPWGRVSFGVPSSNGLYTRV